MISSRQKPLDVIGPVVLASTNLLVLAACNFPRTGWRSAQFLLFATLFATLGVEVIIFQPQSKSGNYAFVYVLNRMHRLNANKRSPKRVRFSMARIAHRPLLFLALVAGVTCTCLLIAKEGMIRI
jgi:hypothetical protein